MFYFYLFFILSLFCFAQCPSSSCITSPSFNCTESQPGVQCGECKWGGWLAPNGTCIRNEFVDYQSCSTTTLSCTSFAGECLPSFYGERCKECSFRGYLALDVNLGITCECYFQQDDTGYACTSLLDDTTPDARLVDVNYTNIYCEPFQSHGLGCFANITTQVRYGDEYPPTPIECCSSIYGPPPGQLIEDGLDGWYECDTFGGFDPNEPFAIGAFRTCSGHGNWNKTSYECECYAQWSGVEIGTDYFTGNKVYSCKTCFGFYGPLPPLLAPSDETTVAFCSAIYTPNEYGELEECGGHGVYRDNECVCHNDPNLGYWDIVNVTQTFVRVLGSGASQVEQVTVQTCSVCYDNASFIFEGCPLSDPSVQLQPYLVPTPPPVSVADVCYTCISYGRTTLTNVQFMQVDSIPSTPCCTLDYYRITTDAVLVYNGTCVENEQKRRHLGMLICQYTDNCVAYYVHMEPDYWAFRFTTNINYLLVYSVYSESGSTCAPTASPRLPTTLYPISSTWWLLPFSFEV